MNQKQRQDAVKPAVICQILITLAQIVAPCLVAAECESGSVVMHSPDIVHVHNQYLSPSLDNSLICKWLANSERLEIHTCAAWGCSVLSIIHHISRPSQHFFAVS